MKKNLFNQQNTKTFYHQFLLLLILFLYSNAWGQGTESFVNITTGQTGYASRTWNGDNGQSWTASDARTDQSINTAAVTVRNGALTFGLTTAQKNAGIGTLTLNAAAKVTPSDNGSLELVINGVTVGTNKTVTGSTTTSVSWTGINVATITSIVINQKTSGARITIDDISWTSYSATPCSGTPAPGNTLASVNPVVSGNTTVLSLQNSTTGSGVTYQWQSSADGVSYNNISGANASTYTATVSAKTWYQCIVTCSGSSGTSSPVTVNIDYCTPTYSSGGANDIITKVQLNTLNDTTIPITTPYYYDRRSAQNAIPDLQRGSTNTVLVTVGNDTNQYGRIWIDFNQNGVFESGESFATATNWGNNGTGSISIVVPTDAVLGNTRMRIRAGDDNLPSSSQACGASGSNYGRAVDYTVNITVSSASTTVTPTSLTGFNATTASDSTQQSFTVSGATLGSNTITITPPTGYQISTTSGSGYSSTPIVLTPTSGTVASTTIYVVLKKSSTTGAANGSITVSSPAVTPDKTISLTGTISKATFTSVNSGTWEAAASWDLNAVPGADDNVVILAAHTITATTAQTRNSGTTTTVSGVLATNDSYLNNGTTTINGTFQINANGWGGGSNDFVYASSGNLIFAHNNGSEYGSIDATHRYWPATSGPVNVTINSNSPINLGVARTVTGILQVAAGFRNLGNITVGTNGTLRLNSGYSWLNTNSSPIYGTSSKLIYNSGGSPGRSNEWTASAGTVGTTAGLPQDVQVSNNTAINFPNGNTATGAGTVVAMAGGIVTVDSGSAIYLDYGTNGNSALIVTKDLLLNGSLSLGNAEGGNITVGGNWTQATAATFSPKGRRVIFNGSATQTITKTGGGTLDFDRVEIQKTNATNVSLSSSAGNLTSLNLNGTYLNALAIIGSGTGGLNLNANTLTFNNDGGDIYVDAAKTIVASSGAVINFNANKKVSNNSGTGSLTFAANAIININNNATVDFGKSSGTNISTVNGVLNIVGNGSSVTPNGPIYATGSKLVYKTAGIYARKAEWNATSGAGYPYDVQVTANTTLNYPNTGSGAFSTALGIARDLTIDSGSSLYMDYGNGGNKSGSLTVGRNIVNSGSLSLGDFAGGDLSLGGSWASSGTFIPNNRAVTFSGSDGNDQTINSATTFDYLTVNKTSTGSVVLAASIIVNKDLTLTNKSIVLGTNNLTLPNNTSIISSNANSYIQAIGTGKLIRQSVDGTKDWTFPMGVAAAGRYAPITIKNLSGTTDLSVNVSTSITPTVSDVTRVLSTKWFVTTTNNVTANIYTEWQGVAAETNSMTIPATGSLATTVAGAPYTFYNVNLVANNTTATAVSLSNTAANGIVIGNDNAIALANDDCSGANNIVINAAAVTGTVVGATQSLAPTCGGSVASDVWYKFTTTDAAYYKIDVQGAISGFDAVLDLRSGACNGTSIACADATGGGAIETITQLLDANTTYYYRVYRYSNSTIANYSFTTSVTSLSTIIATPTTLAFGNVSFDTNSDKTFAVKGSSLSPANGNISIAALSGYSYSLDGITYSSTIDVPYTGGNLSEKTIHVRFHPTLTCTDYNGNIVLSGGGATSVNVSVIGKGVVSATVATDITASTFTANWNAVAGAVGYELDVYKKVVNPNATELFISEYVEGSSNNRYIEIFNGTGNTVDLSDYQLRLYANGSSTPTSLTLSGNLENNSTIVYKNNLATIYTGIATVAATVINYNGNDAVALYKVSTASNVDIFGKIGNDPGTAWTGAGGYSTLDKTLRRKSSILNGVTVNPAGTGSSAFTTLTTEWDVYNIDNISGLGSHDFDGGTKYTYIVQDENVGNVTSHTITGLDANTEYYYVVRAITATCESSNSNEIKVTTTNTIIWNNNAWTNTTGPNTTLDAIIRTPYYVKANSDEFAVHNLTIENTGLLKIKSGHGITVSGDITTPDNKIIIESDASLTQTKIANGNSNNKAIAKRNVKMKTLDYTYWSSPLQDQILLNTTNVNAANSSGGFSAGTPNNRTYEYNEVTDNFKATTNATFVPAKGYAIRGKSTYGTVLAVDSLTFNGNLHNGDYSIQIQKSKNTTGAGGAIYEHGYNLIGNPYPSNINFIKLYNLDQGNGSKNNDVIYGKAWFWTNFSASGTQAGSSYAGNNYATITLAGGTSPTSVDSAEGNPIPNEFIKVAQGFIVQMRGTPPTGTTPNLGTVKFDNSIRTNNNTGHFYNNNKNADEEINRYWVKIVSPYNIANTILIAHMDGATNNYDADYDADLLAVGDDSFYSKVNAQKLQIQARNNPLNNEDVIALGTKHAMSGLYKISLGNREGIFAGSQKIYLRDKLTETYTDLTIQDYSFNANQGIDDNRFEIVYKNKEVLGSESIGKSDFLVYRDGNNFVVKSSNNLGKVELYDVTGKLVQSRYSSDKEVKFDSSVLISGVYIIKAENSGNIRTKKIIK